ncbi:MAG: IclR family transcriptional regulator [Anaerorhabdus sp.]|uniref:IclR family transcriptional regulator n=1 Tax=Anaerorhabdus sp. TaxID=1872524 RepID=UPI002B1E9785|nr:IclR family transcriptional regulator [Anaerorhabdus sp.]MEA4875092.1 IclR family transcriptional regulator [Anaerorhabdus sp.]
MQLVDRVMSALVIVCQSPNGLSVSEISSKMELPLSTTHRVLSSLINNKFIIQDSRTKKYLPSYKIFTLCDNIKKNSILVSQARIHMESLSNEISKNVILCTRQGNNILNLECVEYADSSMYMVKTGIELPLYATSAGRVFMAYMNDAELEQYLSEVMIEKKTDFTITDFNKLNEELKKIKKQQYAMIDEELQLNVQGVACPVFDAFGEVVAAIAFTSAKQADPIDEKKLISLMQCAKNISDSIN